LAVVRIWGVCFDVEGVVYYLLVLSFLRTIAKVNMKSSLAPVGGNILF
jgi:hypothetical protein